MKNSGTTFLKIFAVLLIIFSFSGCGEAEANDLERQYIGTIDQMIEDEVGWQDQINEYIDRVEKRNAEEEAILAALSSDARNYFIDRQKSLRNYCHFIRVPGEREEWNQYQSFALVLDSDGWTSLFQHRNGLLPDSQEMLPKVEQKGIQQADAVRKELIAAGIPFIMAERYPNEAYYDLSKQTITLVTRTAKKDKITFIDDLGPKESTSWKVDYESIRSRVEKEQ